jgi:RNA polymerase sigma-70 factor (ECF subfamily)
MDMRETSDERISRWWGLYSPELIRFVRWRVLDSSVVDDVVSDSFYKLYLNTDQYQDDIHAKKTLFVIARNIIIDRSRAQKKTFFSTISRWWESVPDGAANPEGVAIQKDFEYDLDKALQSLSLLERECILMKYQSGMRYREIASVIGKTESATRKLTSRAVAQLREKLIHHI